MTGPRHPFVAALAALLVAAACPAQTIGEAGQPQPTVNRPEASNRVVRVFDFESHFDDPARAEIHAIPRHWSLAQDSTAAPRPGFPAYNTAELDESVAFAGTGSVRLSSRGGSVSLRLDAGVVPVFPGAEYLVSARVLTRGMTSARAAVRARYLDKSNRPIPASESVSDLAITEFPDPPAPGAWRTLAVTLPVNSPDAAYLQIDLEVLQPREFQAVRLPKHQLWANDFPADAWFDDVAIVQLPRVRLTTASPVNILRRPQKPTITVHLRDLAGESITGRLTLQDAAGGVVDTVERTLGSGQAMWEWSPRVSDLGWYRATLDLNSSGKKVGGTYLDLVWLPAEERLPAVRSEADPARFVVLVDDLPDAGRQMLASLVAATGSGGVSIPAWTTAGTASARQHADLLSPVVEALTRQGRQVSFSLPRVPPPAVTGGRVESDDPLGFLSQHSDVWGPMLLPLLDKFGQTVQRWQIGALGDTPDRGPDEASRLKRLREAMARLVPGPVVGRPWAADRLPPARGVPSSVGELIVDVPYSLPPGAMPLLADSLRETLGPSPPELLMVMETLPRDGYSRLDSASELIKRGVEFWRAWPGGGGGSTPAARAGLVRPWDWPVSSRPQPMPHAELAAWHTMVSRLSGRRIVGTMPCGPGITCYILAGQGATRGGALVAWRSEASPRPASINAFLGEGPITAVDPFGNERPVPAGGSPATHTIEVGDRPVFVEGVDADLALFTSSFRIDPDAVPAIGEEHEVSLVLTNPFRSRADGRITILEPGGLSTGPEGRDRSWSITPRTSAFSIGPGQTVRLPLTIAFSPVEESGPKAVVAEVEFAADRAYGPIRLHSSLDVRMKNLELELAYRMSPGDAGPDVVVEAHATNLGTQPTTLEMTAFAPGPSRAKASIAELAPGETAIRRFSFPGAAAQFRGQRIVVSMQDADTKVRINRSIGIE